MGRSAAAKRGWASRRRRASALAEAVRGTETDKVVPGEKLGELVARVRAAAAARR